MKRIYLLLCLLASYYFINAQAGSLDPSFGVNGVEKINYKAKGPMVSEKGESYRIDIKQQGISTTVKAYKYFSDGTPDLSYGTIGSTLPFVMSGFGSAIEDDGTLLMIGTVQDVYQGSYIVVVHFGLDGSSSYYTMKRPYTSGHLIPVKLIKQGDQILLFSYFAVFDVNNYMQQDFVHVFSSYSSGNYPISPVRNKIPIYTPPIYASTKNVAMEGGKLIVAGTEANEPPLPSFPPWSDYISKYGPPEPCTFSPLCLSAIPDRSFGTNGKIPYPNIGDSRYMLLAPNQKLIIANSVANPITGNTDFRVFRLNQDGSFDQTFNSTGVQTTDFGGDDSPNSIVLQEDKIIVGGVTTNKLTGEKQFAIARFNDDGTLDNSFSDDGKQTLGEAGNYYSLEQIIIKDNRLLVKGSEVSSTGDSAKVTAAYQLTMSNPPVCTATGSILREYWANVTGTLISDIPVNATPSSTSQLNTFEAPTDIADNYAQRIRGYICAPATGNYTFYISGDDESELWLSPSDNPADKRKIAFVGGMQWTNPREWNKYESQKSVTIFLLANTKYYIEALNKEGAGGDNLAVGWLTPGFSGIEVIPGRVLSPFVVANYPPTVAIYPSINGAAFATYSSHNITAIADDKDGIVTKVEFFLNSNKIAEDLSAPYEFNIQLMATGKFNLFVKATDNLGATTQVSEVFTVSDPPMVNISSPVEGATFTAPASINIAATAAAVPSGTGIAKVEFFNGASKIGEDLNYPYEYNWTIVAAGTYTITAKATDNLGLATTSTPVSFTVNASTPVVCTATGSILREYWENVSGTFISDIPVNTTPSSTSQLNNFEAPTDIADNYAQRIRGYICAPSSGNYTFYISGDDESELWLSTSDNPADKRKIASVGGMQWTNPREWTKFESQKSVTIFLQANTKYYIEALNKEGAGGDNLAVGWITPSTSDIVVIPGSVLSPFTGTTTNPPVVCTATGSILREYWANVSGTLISDIPVNATPSSTSQLNNFEAPTDIADNYAQRIRGYICAPATGNYTFYISGDDESELWLSTTDNPADKRKIAFVGGMQWTNPREWSKYESQKSVTIFLQANTKYYIEALNKEGAGGDNLAVGWIAPGTSDIVVIPGSVLSPFTGTTNPPVVCTATGSILREYWANVSGTLISDIPVNATPSSTSQLNAFEAPTDIADNYAQRIRGYICAPATGDYTFYIAGDDESELWLSTSDNPADKRKVASVGGMQWTNPREWTKYESQKSVTIFLQANTKYYIEALNKEGAGGDNLAVGWITPGTSDIVVIPASVLSPFTINPPLNVTTSSPVITSNSIRKIADDVNSIQLSLKSLPNPTITHFTINIKSNKSEPVDLKVVDAVGRVIETKRKVSANGSVNIGDRYHTGIYYLHAVQGSERVTLKLIKAGF